MNTQIYKLTGLVPRVISLKHDVYEGQDLSFSLSPTQLSSAVPGYTYR